MRREEREIRRGVRGRRERRRRMQGEGKRRSEEE
jgi:hypothetical protein